MPSNKRQKLQHDKAKALAAVAATAGKKASVFSIMSAHSLGSDYEQALTTSGFKKVCPYVHRHKCPRFLPESESFM